MHKPLTEYAAEFNRLGSELDEALEWLRDQSTKWARFEVAYKKAHAEATLKATGETVAQREAEADLATARERYEYLMAERMARVAREKVDSVRQQISALQSMLNAERQEMAFEQTRSES